MPDPSPIANAKQRLRERVRAQVRAMSEDQRAAASLAACERIARLPRFIDARTVMLYLPMPGEADCTVLLERCLREGRIVCVPCVEWANCHMEPVKLDSLSDVVSRRHGVREPRMGLPVRLDSIQAVVVPGLAFDERGRRLGRAGGFYDRFLARLSPTIFTIGLAFEAQIVDDLPIEPHDMAVHMVATEQRLIEARPQRRA
jgi:5-formyltetrahydrofolate cyclo-ligase